MSFIYRETLRYQIRQNWYALGYGNQNSGLVGVIFLILLYVCIAREHRLPSPLKNEGFIVSKLTSDCFLISSE